MTCEADGATGEVVADRILVGVGRAPNVEDLGLETAGVRYDADGVVVDDHLRTTNPRIYAAGDVASRYKFTHTADALARIVDPERALAFGRKKASALTSRGARTPRPRSRTSACRERDAAERGIAISTHHGAAARRRSRACSTARRRASSACTYARAADKIVGATLVAAHAGDMISELTLAMAAGAGLGTIAGVIHPYPTQAEVMKKAADAYNRTRLTPLVKKVFAWWLARHR